MIKASIFITSALAFSEPSATGNSDRFLANDYGFSRKQEKQLEKQFNKGIRQANNVNRRIQKQWNHALRRERRWVRRAEKAAVRRSIRADWMTGYYQTQYYTSIPWIRNFAPVTDCWLTQTQVPTNLCDQLCGFMSASQIRILSVTDIKNSYPLLMGQPNFSLCYTSDIGPRELSLQYPGTDSLQDLKNTKHDVKMDLRACKKYGCSKYTKKVLRGEKHILNDQIKHTRTAVKLNKEAWKAMKNALKWNLIPGAQVYCVSSDQCTSICRTFQTNWGVQKVMQYQTCFSYSLP